MMVEGSLPQAQATSQNPKEDPDALVLRGRPVRAIRFRRGIIIGGVAVAALAITMTAWLAFRPRAFPQLLADDDRMAGNMPADALDVLPKGYGDVPKLGPPLPGDLGRPILEHQRAIAGDLSASGSQGGSEAAERLVAERKSARESQLLATSTRSAEIREAPAIPASAPEAQANDFPGPEIDVAGGSNGQTRTPAFSGIAERDGDTNTNRLVPARSPFVMSAGSVIAASLIMGLRSDLPGLVTAQVTHNAYDTASGRILLVPQGARLVGSYDSVVAFGQSRALIVWQRIILPNGSSLKLDNAPATDPSGYAGLSDRVDFHTWQLLKGVVLSTLLGVGTEISISGEGDLVKAIRESTQQNSARAGDQLVSKSLGIQPTITIRPGTPVRLVVNRDLILEPWQG